MSDRKILITSADGQTGHLTAELLLTDEELRSKFSSLVLCAHDTSKCEDLKGEKVEVIPLDYHKDSIKDLANRMKESGADTLYMIPPAHEKKLEIVKNMVLAAKIADIPRCLLLSSAGCDLAEREKQPRMREFVDMETLFMEAKGDTGTETGHSPVILRAGYYAENLLSYNKKIQESGKFPLPIGKAHKFAPVALGDVAHLAAVILTSEGPQGFSDDIRGQLITLTGPQLVAGEELANAASQALSTKMKYEPISEEAARKILDAEAGVDDSEKEYLMEFFSLVREGKTNYVSTLAYKMATGTQPTLPTEFFGAYRDEFKPKRRKTNLKDTDKGDKVGGNSAEDSKAVNPQKSRGRK